MCRAIPLLILFVIAILTPVCSGQTGQPEASGEITFVSPNSKTFTTSDDIEIHCAGIVTNNENFWWIKGKIAVELQKRVKDENDPNIERWIPMPMPAGNQPNDCDCASEKLIDVKKSELLCFHRQIGTLPVGDYRVKVELMARYNGHPDIDGEWHTLGEPEYGEFEVVEAPQEDDGEDLSNNSGFPNGG